MSEQATSGTSAEPAPRPGQTPASGQAAQPAPRRHRVVRSEDLPRFSIGTPIAVGSIIWVVLLAGGLWQHDRLVANGNGWWIWTAVTGIVLGLLGWLYTVFRLKDQPGQVVEPAEPGQAPEPIQPAPSDAPATPGLSEPMIQ